MISCLCLVVYVSVIYILFMIWAKKNNWEGEDIYVLLFSFDNLFSALCSNFLFWISMVHPYVLFWTCMSLFHGSESLCFIYILKFSDLVFCFFVSITELVCWNLLFSSSYQKIPILTMWIYFYRYRFLICVWILFIDISVEVKIMKFNF